MRAPAADDGLARLTDSFHLNLTAFGVLAFAVGIFIVHAAIGLAFEQRRAMMRTLRALGVPGRLLAALVMVELLALALVAGLIGVGLGLSAGRCAVCRMWRRRCGGLYGAAVPGTLDLRPGWALAGLGMAVAGTLAAGRRGIWQLSAPAAAGIRRSRRPGRWRRRRCGAGRLWPGLVLLARQGSRWRLGAGFGPGSRCWRGFCLGRR